MSGQEKLDLGSLTSLFEGELAYYFLSNIIATRTE